MKISYNKRIAKRIWSLIIVLAVFVCSFNNKVLAESTFESGTCGEGVTWTLSKGCLTISGEGEIEDYTTISYGVIKRQPWFEYRGQIDKVIVEEGITKIGKGAFSFLIFLRSINLPQSLESIDYYGIYDCDRLESIIIPSNISYIAPTAFCSCEMLKEVVLSDSNSYYCIENNILYSKDKKVLYCYPAGKKDANYTIEGFVETIANRAFSDAKNIESIYIPDNVNRIDEFAFSGCFNLKSVRMPHHLEGTLEDTFSSCINLLTIAIPEGITKLDGTFTACKKLKRVSLPNTLKDIVGGAFQNSLSLDTVFFPKSVSVITGYSFVRNNLKSITIPSLVEEVKHDFIDMPNLESVVIEEGVKIVDGAFNTCPNLKSVTIPKSLTDIKNSSFSKCDNLKTVKYEGTKSDWEKINGKRLLSENVHEGIKVYCTDGIYTETDNNSTDIILKANILCDTNKLPYKEIQEIKKYPMYDPSGIVINDIDGVKQVLIATWDNQFGIGFIKNPSTASTYQLKYTDLYFAALLKLLKDSETGYDVFSKSEKLMRDLEKKAYTLASSYTKAKEIEKLQGEERQNFKELLFSEINFGKASASDKPGLFKEVTKTVDTIMETASTVEDALSMVNNIIILRSLSDDYKVFLYELKNNVSSDDIYLGAAIDKAILCVEDPVLAYSLYAGKVGYSMGSKILWKKVISSIEKTYPEVAAVFMAFDLGFLFGDVLTGVSEINKSIYECAVYNHFLSFLNMTYLRSINKYKTSQTETNAKVLVASEEILRKVILCNYDAAIRYANAVKLSGTNVIFNIISGKQQRIIDTINDLNNEKSLIGERYIAINNYIGEQYTNSNSTYIIPKKAYTYKIYFACPIDVEITSNNGQSFFEGNKLHSDGQTVLSKEGDKKIVLMDSDTDLYIGIKGTGMGRMDCGILSYNEAGYLADEKGYYDVPISKDSFFAIDAIHSESAFESSENPVNELIEQRTWIVNEYPGETVSANIFGGIIRNERGEEYISFQACSNKEYTISASIPVGYKFSHWICNIVDVIQDYESPVTEIIIPNEDIEIEAVFEKEENTYSLRSDCGEGGEISIIGTFQVKENESFKYYISPYDGNEIHKVIIDGKEAEKNNLIELDNIISDHNIYVSFKKENEFLVSFDSNNGTKIDSIWVLSQNKISRPKDPSKDGEIFSGWYKEKELENMWDFDKDIVKSDTVLYAKWEQRKTYKIITIAGLGGEISPNGDFDIYEGEEKSFNIIPGKDFRIKDVKVDNVSIGTVSTYTFRDVSNNHTIAAFFEKTVGKDSSGGNDIPGSEITPGDKTTPEEEKPENTGDTDTPTVEDEKTMIETKFKMETDVKIIMLTAFKKSVPDAIVKKVKFKTSNKKIVKVNKKGKAKGGKKSGTATITMYIKIQEIVTKPNGKQKKKTSKWTLAGTLTVNNTGKLEKKK